MDKRVQEVIKSLKREEKESLLISFGLYTEVGERSYWYSSDDGKYPYYDEERQEYYSVKRVPIEVSDEEYEELREIAVRTGRLGVATEAEMKDETFANKIANYFIIGTLLLYCILFLIFIVQGISDRNPWLCGAGIGVLLIGLQSWAAARMFIELSRDIRYIRRKMK